MTRPGQARSVALGAVVGIVVTTVVVLLLSRVGSLGSPDGPGVRNSLQVEVASCLIGLVVRPGTDLYRDCIGPVDGLDVRVTAAGFDARRDDVKDRFSVEGLPAGPIRLQADGVADGTVDVLSCRSYAQSTGTEGVVASLVPEIAYSTEPMTASIIAQPYVISDGPDAQWQATMADPTDGQLADRPDLYGTVFRCTWFLLPPGSVTDRPGIVRTYTSTATAGEPEIHVLGSGAAADPSQSVTDPLTTEPIPTFDFDSHGDGTTLTTGDSWIDHYLLPAGSWTVTDRTTGRQATVDVAPGQTTRVVSVTGIRSPGSGTPVATPLA